jgi:hypothetical protein
MLNFKLSRWNSSQMGLRMGHVFGPHELVEFLARYEP